MPTLLCFAKLLAAFAGCDTAVLLHAHAKVLTIPGLRLRLDHLLHPEQRTSTVQCVEFVVELRVL